MRRYLLPTAAAVAVVGLLVSPVQALRIAPPQPDRLALTTPVVITGKVTSIEKDTVEASSPFAGAKDKQKYKIAVVKVNAGLSGIDGSKVKEIKIGFIPPPMPEPNPPGGQATRRSVARSALARWAAPTFPDARTQGRPRNALLPREAPDRRLLRRSPASNRPNRPHAPTPAKKQLADVQKVTAVLADPMKGLKSDKADVRA